MQAEECPRRLSRWVVFSGLLVLAGIGFFTFPVAFLQYEDAAYITQNPHVAPGLGLRTWFSGLTSAPENNWIPLTWWFMAAETSLGGPPSNPIVFRAFSIALHALAGLLIWELAERPVWVWPSVLGMGLFLVHPQRVETVVWASSQKDLVATCLALGTLLSWQRYHKSWCSGERPGLPLVAFGLFALGLMAKQSILAIPIICWLITRRPGTVGLPLKALTVLCLLAAAGAGAALLANRNSPGAPPVFGLPWWDALLNAPAAWGWQIRQTVWPGVFFPEYGRPEAHVGYAAVGMVVLLALVVPAIRYLAAWAWPAWALAFLPVSGLVPLPMPFTADRLHYFPSAMLALGFLQCQSPGSPWQSTLLPGGARFLLVGVACGVIGVWLDWSRKQSRVWQNDRVLFEHTLQAAPRHAVALTNLGVIALQNGDSLAAAGFFEKATTGDRQLLTPWHNLTYTLIHLGQAGRARASAGQAVLRFPQQAGAWMLLTDAAEAEGDYQAALEASEKASALAPHYPAPVLAKLRLLRLLGRADGIPALLSSLPAVLREHPEVQKASPVQP